MMNDLHDDLDRAAHTAPASTLTLERLHSRRDRSETHRRVGAMVVALAIGVAAVGGVVMMLDEPGTGNDVRTVPAGTETVFGPPTDVALAEGQYVYTRTTHYTYVPDLVEPSHRETWWAGDDSGRMAPSGVGRYDVYAAGEFPIDEIRDYLGDLSDLSTDPAVLEQQLADRLEAGGTPGAPALPTPAPGKDYPLKERMGTVIAGLIGSADVLPELKAACFRVLADQPGITIVRNGTDPVGRPAIELWWHNEHTFPQITRVWFDARTEQAMAWENANDLPDDSRTYFISIVERAGIVDSTSSTDLLTAFFPSTIDAPAASD